jgi:hypothetical protein
VVTAQLDGVGVIDAFAIKALGRREALPAAEPPIWTAA